MARKQKKTKMANKTRQSLVAPMANVGKRLTMARTVGPKVVTKGDSMLITNKEFFLYKGSDTSALRIGSVGLNPANSFVFPWLSALAKRYTYYRWKSLRVLYGSSCPTSQRGLMTMGLFYDLEDANAWFSTSTAPVRDLTQTVGSSQGPVWGSTVTCHPNGTHSSEIQVVCDVNRAHMRTRFHLIDDNTAGTALDNQAVAVYLGHVTDPNGQADGLGCGVIWFDYEIELLHPTAVTSNPSTAFAATARIAGASDPQEVSVPWDPPYVRKPPTRPKDDPADEQELASL